jgi:hypothetical protein
MITTSASISQLAGIVPADADVVSAIVDFPPGFTSRAVITILQAATIKRPDFYLC